MNGPIDYTGYGYSSGGFAPSPADSAAARRNKAQMDRMSDYMQKLDPVLNKTLETLVRTQIRNGATPEEARRAAFGSAQGQLLSDTMLGLRKTGFLGQGNPIDYGRNVLQGVAGGGFSVDILAANGRAQGMGQSVMGGGILSGTASMQMAKDLMTQLYGAGGSDPRQAYGHNMEQASMVFRKLAERGALGNIGTVKQYGAGDRELRTGKFSAEAVDEKIATARRQEVDKEILAALEGVNSDNIGDKIKEYKKKGDDKIAQALTDIEVADSNLVMNDANTKRIADITKETLKGLSNMKEIFGHMNNPQLLAQMEALSGIRITNKAEARKAANITGQLVNTALATGNDPASVINMVIGRMGGIQDRLSQTYGAEYGQGGARGSIGKEIAAGMANAAANSAMTTEASIRGNAAEMKEAYGIDVSTKTKEDILADNQEQLAVFSEQNPAFIMASGMARSIAKGDTEFQAAYNQALRDYKKAPDENTRSEIESRMRRLVESKTGRTVEDFRMTGDGSRAFASADQMDIIDASNIASSAASRADISDKILDGAGLSGDEKKAASSAYSGRLGAGGMRELADAKDRDAREARLKKFVETGYLSEEQASAISKNMDAVSVDQFREQMRSVEERSGRGQAEYELEVSNIEAMSRTYQQQHGEYSDEQGLSLTKIMNSILADPKENALNTDTKRIYTLEALQKEGMAQGLAKTSTIDFSKNLTKEDLGKIRDAGGDMEALLTRMGAKTEEELLAKQDDDGSVRRRIYRTLQADTKLMMGGALDDTRIMNADQRDEIMKRAKNVELAAKYKDLMGMEDGASSPALEELLETGKISKGGLAFGIKTDGFQKVYDNDGDSGFWNWNDEKNNPENKVHFSQATKLAGLAARVNSEEEGADMIELNNLGGGGLLKAMEEQLAQYEDAQSRGAKVIQTSDGKDGYDNRDMGESIQQLKDAIERLKSDDGKSGEKATEHMTVTNLYVDGVLPRKG